MKKFKKALTFAVVGALLISCVSLTSCKKSGGDTLTVGVDDTYPPMEFKNTSSKGDVGFDIDMANEIGNRTKMKVKLQSTAWDGIFPALNAKRFDCIISSVSITKDREKDYIFSKPYIANAQMIVVKKDEDSIKSKEDLKGVNVGCQVNTTASDSADKLIKTGVNLKLTTYDQIIQCFQAMKAGKVKAIIVDEVVGEYYIKQSPTEYKGAAFKLTNEPIGICFRKSDTALRDKVQKAIDSMVSDGTMAKISKKWFGKDLTSNIDSKLKMM